MSRIGVALIGLGGKRLAAAVKQTPSLRLVTCFSRNEAQRRAFEAAIEHAGVCAERGKHVFVEKPIADTLADGRAMQAACQAAGVTLLVGHAFRRLGAARKVKQLLDQGALGTVVLAEANFSLPGTLTPDK